MTNLLLNYMNAFPERFIFTDTDQRDCLDVIHLMMKLAQRANEVKPLNLEEEAYQTDIYYLKKALFLYIDNIECSIFKDIMETYIVFGGYAGKELLEKLIILDGIIGIYNTESTGLIEERLKAYLSERFAPEYEKRYSTERSRTTDSLISKPAEPELLDSLDLSSFLRKKVEPKKSNPNVILSQAEIDELVKTLLGNA